MLLKKQEKVLLIFQNFYYIGAMEKVIKHEIYRQIRSLFHLYDSDKILAKYNEIYDYCSAKEPQADDQIVLKYLENNLI